MSGVLVLLVVHMGVASPCGQFYLPDKEFRYLRHCCYSSPGGEWPDHFCLAPHVAMRIGLYLHRLFSGLGVQSLRIPCGFLLIVRTDRIVTVLVVIVRNVGDEDEYRRILGCSSI
jgi:hypothetical protein